MPLCCDPDQTFELSLKSDADKPTERRPAFVYRHLTGRQFKTLLVHTEQLEQSNDSAVRYEMLFAAVGVGMTGWRHVADPDGDPLEFDKAQLDNVLSIADASELLGLLIASASPSREDQKKYDSPSPSSGAGSAATAPPAAA